MGTPIGASVFRPLQPFVRGFLVGLVELGYSRTVQVNRLRLMAELSAWMAAEGFEPADLTVSLVAEFVASFRARGPKREWFSSRSERHLVGYLQGLGLVLKPEAVVVLDPVEVLVGSSSNIWSASAA